MLLENQIENSTKLVKNKLFSAYMDLMFASSLCNSIQEIENSQYDISKDVQNEMESILNATNRLMETLGFKNNNGGNKWTH